VAKHWALIFLIVYLLILTDLSFTNIAGLPSLGSPIDDKIFHFLSHFLLTVLCFNYLKRTSNPKPVLVSALIPVCYGIVIEWLQGILTNSRTSDPYDVLANFLGMVFAIIIISIFKKNVKLN